MPTIQINFTNKTFKWLETKDTKYITTSGRITFPQLAVCRKLKLGILFAYTKDKILMKKRKNKEKCLYISQSKNICVLFAGWIKTDKTLSVTIT